MKLLNDVVMTLRHRAIKPFLDVENDVDFMFVKLFRSLEAQNFRFWIG